MTVTCSYPPCRRTVPIEVARIDDWPVLANGVWCCTYDHARPVAYAIVTTITKQELG